MDLVKEGKEREAKFIPPVDIDLLIGEKASLRQYACNVPIEDDWVRVKFLGRKGDVVWDGGSSEVVGEDDAILGGRGSKLWRLLGDEGVAG
ncbi:hypothetical protein LIER_17933 [Lithospermum erythrorhizon]|uniref:Uncharacterized protein n=1 Tax=Lithospermum erythrorhizon TaxID=34254 RepID=A0AAV3QFE6_LITER